MKLIDIEKVKAGIKKLQEEYSYGNSSEAMFMNKAYNELLDFLNTLPEEHQEDLEEAAMEYAKSKHQDKALQEIVSWDFKAGAQWQMEQFEKNRLAACDRQTEEEAKMEEDFCMSIIENEHRQPTYSDTIKFGIQWQKQQQEDCPKIKGWVARDEDDNLFIYRSEKPSKKDGMWSVTWRAGEGSLYLPQSLLPEVKWEDEEPTEVELIIKKI